MQIGLLILGDFLADPTTGRRVSETERHRSFVDQAVLAEDLGFDAVHLGEHHFSDYILSCPPVVLSAIGERTTNLVLSTAVTLAGNLDPVRMAEDYATVDVLSGGRVELVTGRGALFVRTYEGFGQPVGEARDRYDESVRLLHRLLREEDVHWSGRFRPALDGFTTRPRPVGDLPTWIGAGSRESVELAAELGAGLMLPSVFGSPELFAPLVAMYHEAWEQAGRPAEEARVGACSHTHVGPSTSEARRQWEPYYRQYWDFVGGLLDAGGFADRWPAFDLDELLAGPAVCGSPEAVIDRMGTWHEILGLDRHLFMFDLGGIDDRRLRSTMERFGADVLPAVRLLGA